MRLRSATKRYAHKSLASHAIASCIRQIYDSGLLQRVDAFPHLAEAQTGVYERIVALYAAAAGMAGLDATEVKARVIAFWATIFGYAKLRQVELLQPYMTDGLPSASIEFQLIRTAIGPDIIASTART